MNLANLINRSIFELSGGEKQKIACGSISMYPKILVLDEPTANLDQDSKKGFTIVLSEHQLYWLKDLAKSVCVCKVKKAIPLKNFTAKVSKTLREMELQNFQLTTTFEKVKAITEGKKWELHNLGDKTPDPQQAPEIVLENLSVSFVGFNSFSNPETRFLWWEYHRYCR